MCQGREHRYRIEIKVTLAGGVKEEHSLVTYAKGVADAIAKADGWAHENCPNAEWVNFETHHSAYRSDEGALDHGAILSPNRIRFSNGATSLNISG